VKDFGEDKGISRVFEGAASFVRDAIGDVPLVSENDILQPTGGSGSIVLAIEEAAAALPPASNRARVLIHCANGSNRSATVAIALLMDLLSITLQTAALFVKTKHTPTLPLRDNCEQLMAYETSSRGLAHSTLEKGPQFFTARRGSRGSSSRSAVELELPGAVLSFEKYEKMKRMGLPDGAVMGRMQQDRVSDEKIQAFFGGNAAFLAAAAPAAPTAPALVSASTTSSSSAITDSNSVHVICLGDSLTAGHCGLGQEDEPWAGVMAAEVERQHRDHAELFNQTGGIRSGSTWTRIESATVHGCSVGVVGYTSSQLVRLLEESPGILIKQHSGSTREPVGGGVGGGAVVNVVIIMVGTNDIGSALADRSVDPVALLITNLRALHRRCHDAGAATVAVNILESQGVRTHDRLRELHTNANEAIKLEFGAGSHLADGQCRSMFVDMCSELPYDDTHSSFWANDGLHLNAQGYAEFGKRIAPLVAEFIMQHQPQQRVPPPQAPPRSRRRRRQRGGSAAGLSFDQPETEFDYGSDDDGD
jgi:lysophospholipase L1-like esterase